MSGDSKARSRVRRQAGTSRAQTKAELERRVRKCPAAEQPNAAPAQETEERFRLFVDSVRHRAILMLDPDGRIATWSAGARRLMAYAPDEIIGEHVSVLYAEDDRRAAHPGHALEQADRDGQYEEEGWRLRKRGVKFWADTMLTALRDDAGRLRGFGMVIRDFSERRKADEASSLIGRVFATSLDLILVVDRQGRFIQVSPSSLALLGYAPEELIGRNALELIHPEDLAGARGEMRLARRGPVTRNFDCRYVHKDGRLVTLAWKGVWSEPEQQHFFIGRDMTERMAAEEKLRRAQRLEAIGQLTGGMAHDFNNLLGVIIGNLDLARPLVAQSREAGELVGESLAAALKGADLTRRLLAFARQQPLQPQHVRINEVVTETLKLLSRTLGEDIETSLDLAPDIWPAIVDPAQFEASLVNLATNARDAMPKGGGLTIVTANRSLDADYAAVHPDVLRGDYAMVQVSDTGTGMPPAVLARIFEPFYTTKDRGQGSGLGLSMVIGFIKQSGGHIDVYSEPGRGTTFRLYLPKAAASVDSAPQIREPAPAGAGETVLAVEDNRALRRLVVRQLKELGYRVIEADSAAAALAVLESRTVNVLFTDMVMPGAMNGVGLARLVLERWPSVRVILTSGFSQAKIIQDAGQLAPSVRLLSKPYLRQDLASAVRDALSEQPAPSRSEGRSSER